MKKITLNDQINFIRERLEECEKMRTECFYTFQFRSTKFFKEAAQNYRSILHTLQHEQERRLKKQYT